MARLARKHMAVNRKGFKEEIALITQLFLSTYKISIGKGIKKVCMEVHGFKISACPGRNSFVPKSPLALLEKVSAITTLSAKTLSFLLLVIFIEIVKPKGTPFRLVSKVSLGYDWGLLKIFSGREIPLTVISSRNEGLYPVALKLPRILPWLSTPVSSKTNMSLRPMCNSSSIIPDTSDTCTILRFPSGRRAVCTIKWMAEAIISRIALMGSSKPDIKIIESSLTKTSLVELAWTVVIEPSWPVFIA